MTENYSKQPSPDGIVFGQIPNNKLFRDLTGMQFKEWKVLGYSRVRQNNGRSTTLFWCKCACGTVREVCSAGLIHGQSGSCGCLKKRLTSARHTTHGGSKTSEYCSYKHMLSRCFNEKHHHYVRYGGAGITVYPGWTGENGFKNFLEYMGNKPSRDYTIGRINGAGNYEPGNVRWETREQQSNNIRSNVLIEHNGRTQTLARWSKELGIPSARLRWRMKTGLDFDSCINEEVGLLRDRRVEWNGVTKTIREWSKITGFTRNRILTRLSRGWSVERSLTEPLRKVTYPSPKKPSQTTSTGQHA